MSDCPNVDVVEVIEPGTVIEFTVELGTSDRPERDLLYAVASYLADHADRVPVVTFAVSYGSSPPAVHGTLVTTRPVTFSSGEWQ